VVGAPWRAAKLVSLLSKGLLEEIQQVSVMLDDEVANIMAHSVSGMAETTTQPNMVKCME